jgi:hypothetical protein
VESEQLQTAFFSHTSGDLDFGFDELEGFLKIGVNFFCINTGFKFLEKSMCKNLTWGACVWFS